MTTLLFVDTGAFLSRFDARDQYHQESILIWKILSQEGRIFLTTHHVLDELATLLARKMDYAFSAREITLIYQSSMIIERSDVEDEKKALVFFRKYADQKGSFTDCLSFVIMQKLKIRDVFTFDRHFSDAGFIVLPD